MSLLDNLPLALWFFTIGPRKLTYVMAGLGVAHPLAYYYTCISPFHYLFPWIYVAWIMSLIWSGLSIGLEVGNYYNNEIAFEVWVWFMLVFVPTMMILMLSMIVESCICNRAPCHHVTWMYIALMFYFLMVYATLVVNDQRRSLKHMRGGYTTHTKRPPPTTSGATTWDPTTWDPTTWDPTTWDATDSDATTSDATTSDATTSDSTTPLQLQDEFTEFFL